MRCRVKVLYTSDLHGEFHLYEQLFRLTQSSSAQIIALGGDLFPSFSPTRRYEDILPHQRAFIDQFLLPFFKNIIENTDVKLIFLIPGNWDLAYPYLFKSPYEFLIDLDRNLYRLSNGYEIIGYSFVPPTPFRPKDYEKMDHPDMQWPPQKNPSYVRISDQGEGLIPIDPYHFLRNRGSIEEDLKRLPKPQTPERSIFITHSPPFGTCLDQIQGGKSAGSQSIRAYIETLHPFLTLHGHIHEAPKISGTFIDRIGETVSINPGQFISKQLHAVIFDFDHLTKTLKHTYLSDINSDLIFKN